ncbi:MAG TPA: DUF2007 domain-containing protein, partial [Myxococcota bacterium]|nr:DUF2007 domain-containing protein [Myxococcota bacterium]
RARMSETDLVTIATFSDPPSAEVAAARLRAAGIASRIRADDAGGAYPQLQPVRGVRLQVGAANATRARELLGATEAPPEVIESERETRLAEEKVRGSRPWNIPVLTAFLAGLALGLGLGIALSR